MGYTIKNKLKDVNFYKDRDNQIEAIENLFEAVKKPVTNLNLICLINFLCQQLSLSKIPSHFLLILHFKNQIIFIKIHKTHPFFQNIIIFMQKNIQNLFKNFYFDRSETIIANLASQQSKSCPYSRIMM